MFEGFEFVTTDTTTRRQRQQRKAHLRVARKAALAVISVIMGVAAGVVGHEVTAQAGTQVQVNQYIRSHGGIPACINEDGSGQKGACYWNGSKRGNGKGRSYIAIDRKGKDDAIVYLNGPLAKRY